MIWSEDDNSDDGHGDLMPKISHDGSMKDYSSATIQKDI